MSCFACVFSPALVAGFAGFFLRVLAGVVVGPLFACFCWFFFPPFCSCAVFSVCWAFFFCVFAGFFPRRFAGVFSLVGCYSCVVGWGAVVASFGGFVPVVVGVLVLCWGVFLVCSFVFSVAPSGVCSFVSARSGRVLSGGAVRACSLAVLRRVVRSSAGSVRAVRRSAVSSLPFVCARSWCGSLLSLASLSPVAPAAGLLSRFGGSSWLGRSALFAGAALCVFRGAVGPLGRRGLLRALGGASFVGSVFASVRWSLSRGGSCAVPSFVGVSVPSLAFAVSWRVGASSWRSCSSGALRALLGGLAVWCCRSFVPPAVRPWAWFLLAVLGWLLS